MYCKSYPLQYQAYKVILTLSLTQVACERTFSKLEYVKNRLKSQLSEDRLDSLLLTCVERDILARVSNDMVIVAAAHQVAVRGRDTKQFRFLRDVTFTITTNEPVLLNIFRGRRVRIETA